MNDPVSSVVSIVSNQFGIDKTAVTRESHFVNDFNADSLDMVELVMEFEDEFDISIADAEAERLATVGQVIDHVNNKLSEKESK